MPELTMSQQFRGFGGACRRDGGTTYAAICEHVAGDPALLALAEAAPPAQRRPNLLLAAVHFLLLQGDPHPLGAFYDTVSPTRARPTEEVGQAFADFCAIHRDQLFELVCSRSTQTNEVGRCAILLPALCAIGERHGGEPIALLDLGASAGLNLLFDQYRYTYRGDDDTAVEAGDPRSAVQLECEARGGSATLPALTMPRVSARAGLDLSPVDAASDDGATWLLACLWPDNLPRFERARSALAMWQQTTDRPHVVAGDMIDDLAHVAAGVGSDEPLVVFHSWVAAYLTEARQKDLVEAVADLGHGRPVHHLYAELPFETPGLPSPTGPEDHPGAKAETALVHIGPEREPQRWANVHPHGTWVRWLPTPTGPTARHAASGLAPRPG